MLVAFHTAMASESFGGLGLAIYPSKSGAEVACVVQGAPAHLAGIENGDFLVAANGVSLAGKPLEFDTEVLRGDPEEPVELTVLRNSDTLRVLVRREAIVANTPADGELSGMAFNVLADESLRFLDAVELPGLRADVYAKVSEKSASVTNSRKDSKKIHPLPAFDRSLIRFELESSGHATVDVFSAHGQKVESLEVEGFVGMNQLDWNGAGLSSGSYFVQISQNGKTLYYKGELR